MNPSAVRYELVAGVPGRYFRCDRYGLLSVDACSRNFSAAPKLASEGRLAGCVGCPAGIVHAGGHKAASARPVLAVCSRCRRDPSDASMYRSTRQGRIRMVRDGELCVSCFNREREVMLGRNARKTKPRDLVLRSQSVGYIVDACMSVAQLPAIKDSVEGALTVMRRSGGKALVAWVGTGVQQATKPGRRDDLQPHRPRMQLLLWTDP